MSNFCSAPLSQPFYPGGVETFSKDLLNELREQSVIVITASVE